MLRACERVALCYHDPRATVGVLVDIGSIWRQSPGALKVAVVAALLGFVVKTETTSYQSVNGALTDCSYTNWAGVLLGAFAIGAVIAAIARSRQQKPDQRLPTNVLAIVVALVGVVAVYHIISGFGIVGGACN